MRFTLILGLAILIPLSAPLAAKDKKPKSPPQDSIEVVAHIDTETERRLVPVYRLDV